MVRQHRFLVFSSLLGIAACVTFLILLGAQPTSASTPIGQGVPALNNKPLEQAGSVDRGKYLVAAGACANCHGARNLAKPGEEPPMAGGMAFDLGPIGTYYAANLTKL